VPFERIESSGVGSIASEGSTLSSGYARKLVDAFEKFRGGIEPEIAERLIEVKTSIERQKKAASLGSFAVEQATARAFFDTLVRPYLLKGNISRGSNKKTFVPDTTYKENFAKKLSDDGLIAQMYIRLLQSRPGEQPDDSRIGYGALELLRTWAIRLRVADEIGLDYSVNIVDETGAFDHGEQLGFTPEAMTDSYEAMELLLSGYGVKSGSLTITPFGHQASLYRGENALDSTLMQEYERLLEANIKTTKGDLQQGIFSLGAIRAVMIHRLRYGDVFSNVSANRDFDYLTNFSPDDVDESLFISESFNGALQMRPAVKRRVGELGAQLQFPEFFSKQERLHWGISKKDDRLSIQPNFKAYKGQPVTLGYAIPVYSRDNGGFAGLTAYAEHSRGGFEVVNGPNELPVAVIE